MWRGLTVVTLGVMVLSGIQLLVTPPLRAVDERSWVDYGWEVVGGDLPAIDEQLGAAPLGGERPPHFHTAAHHPPLFPVAAGSVLRVGEALGFGDASITIARLLSLAALGLSTIALAGVVSEVLPGRPQAWIGATAVLMGLPGVTQLGAVLYSDTTALAAGLVAMWGAVRILRLGPSTPRLCATGAAIALCGMVRFSALALAVVPLAVLLVGLLRNGREQGAWHVTSRAALTGGAIVAAVAISSGWFYLRNVRRYGDISGGAYLYELLGRRPRPLSNILTQAFWSKRYRTLWDGREYGTGEYAAPGLVGLSWRYLWAWVAAGGVAIVIAVRRGLRSPVHDGLARLLLAVAAVATVALVVYGLIDHVLDGGNGHVRYLLGAWWVPAVAVAATLATFRRPWPVVLVALSWVALVWSTAAVLDEAVATSALGGAHGDSTLERLWSLAGTADGPGPALVMALAVMALLSVVAVPWSLAPVPTDLASRPDLPEPAAPEGLSRSRP